MWFVLLAFTALGACGVHRELDESDDDANTAGRSSAGKGGRGGAGGAGGRAGGTAGTAAGYVKCGSKQCAPPANILAGLPLGIPLSVACCADSSTGLCGAAAAAGELCEPPAKVDARCPGVNLGGLGAIAGGGMMVPADAMNGCCTPDNACGLDGALFGRGCVENGEVAAVLGAIPLLGSLIMVPASRACDAPPADDAADGGA